jgi:hypothetical protein
MQATTEMDESTRQGGQDLPTTALPVGTPWLIELAARSRAASTRLDAAPSGDMVTTLSASNVAMEKGGSAVEAEANQPRSGTTDTVRQAIEDATVSLRRMDATSISLVIRPDRQTEVALHLDWREGHCEATAVVERGDAAALGAQWGQLQQRLAAQGVQLAPLATGKEGVVSSGGGHGGGSFTSSENQRQLASRNQVPASFTPKTQARKSGAKTIPARNGSEWWA